MSVGWRTSIDTAHIFYDQTKTLQFSGQQQVETQQLHLQSLSLAQHLMFPLTNGFKLELPWYSSSQSSQQLLWYLGSTFLYFPQKRTYICLLAYHWHWNRLVPLDFRRSYSYLLWIYLSRLKTFLEVVLNCIITHLELLIASFCTI